MKRIDPVKVFEFANSKGIKPVFGLILRFDEIGPCGCALGMSFCETVGLTKARELCQCPPGGGATWTGKLTEIGDLAGLSSSYSLGLSDGYEDDAECCDFALELEGGSEDEYDAGYEDGQELRSACRSGECD